MLAELRKDIFSMVSEALESFANGSLAGSATGKSSSSSSTSAPLPSSVASSLAPAPPTPVTTTTPMPATAKAAAPSPTPTHATPATPAAPVTATPSPTPTISATPAAPSELEDESLAQYIATASPFATELDDQLKIVRRQVQAIPVASGVTFPQSSNIGLSKDEKAAVAHMQDSCKLFRTILQIAARMAHRFPDAKSDIEDIATVALVGMRTLLRARDETWMVKALPAEALPAFRALEGSSVLAQDRDRFFSTLKFAALKQQASKPSTKPNGKWKGSSSQSSSSSSSSSSSFPKSKGKKPYYNKSSTSSGRGAGSSANQD